MEEWGATAWSHAIIMRQAFMSFIGWIQLLDLPVRSQGALEHIEMGISIFICSSPCLMSNPISSILLNAPVSFPILSVCYASTSVSFHVCSKYVIQVLHSFTSISHTAAGVITIPYYILHHNISLRWLIPAADSGQLAKLRLFKQTFRGVNWIESAKLIWLMMHPEICQWL